MLSMMLSLLLTQWNAPPEPTIKLLRPEGKMKLCRCEVTNTSKVSWYFHGYSAATMQSPLPAGRVAPVPVIQHMKEGKWVSQFDGRCGVGISPIELPAGATAWFEMYLTAPGNTETRIGLYMNYGKDGGRHRHVWSNSVKTAGE